jgi:hypothetical protein
MYTSLLTSLANPRQSSRQGVAIPAPNVNPANNRPWVGCHGITCSVPAVDGLPVIDRRQAASCHVSSLLGCLNALASLPSEP